MGNGLIKQVPLNNDTQEYFIDRSLAIIGMPNMADDHIAMVATKHQMGTMGFFWHQAVESVPQCSNKTYDEAERGEVLWVRHYTNPNGYLVKRKTWIEILDE